MSYTIHVDHAKGRVWIMQPVPIEDLRDIIRIARRAAAYASTRAVRSSSLIFITDVSQHIGASLAICHRNDGAAWRAELGLAAPERRGG